MLSKEVREICAKGGISVAYRPEEIEHWKKYGWWPEDRRYWHGGGMGPQVPENYFNDITRMILELLGPGWYSTAGSSAAFHTNQVGKDVKDKKRYMELSLTLNFRKVQEPPVVDAAGNLVEA